MPKLTQVVGFLEVEGIFKASVAMAQFLEKLVFGRHVVEIEGIARREDDDLL